MCHRPTDADLRTARETQERVPGERGQEQHGRVRPWVNTRPRENPRSDRRDFERSLERLESVLGR